MLSSVKYFGIVTFVGASVLCAAETESHHPKESAGVSAVAIRVEATDRHGRPVTDLGPEDFVVTDGGNIQTLLSATYMGTVRRGTESEVSAPEREQPAPQPRTLILLFDLVFTNPRSLGGALEAARGFVRTELQPGDSIAVFTISDMGWRAMTVPTTDRDRVLHALDGRSFAEGQSAGHQAASWMSMTAMGLDEASRVGPDTAWSGVSRLSESYGQDSVPDAPNAEMRDVIEGYLTSLQSLAVTLRLVPGQKNMLLFSSGIDQAYFIPWVGNSFFATNPSFDSNQLDRVEKAVRALASAECRVYAIDPSTEFHQFPRASFNRQWFLQEVSSETGGKMYGNRDDLHAVVQTVASESSAYYLLLYSSPQGDRGRYHKLSVSVRRPGIHLTFRRGYYESRPFGKYDDVEKRTRVESILSIASSSAAPKGIKAMAIPAVDPSGDRLGRLAMIQIDLDPPTAKPFLDGVDQKLEAYIVLRKGVTGEKLQTIHTEARRITFRDGVGLRVGELVRLPEDADQAGALIVGAKTSTMVVVPSFSIVLPPERSSTNQPDAGKVSNDDVAAVNRRQMEI